MITSEFSHTELPQRYHKTQKTFRGLSEITYHATVTTTVVNHLSIYSSVVIYNTVSTMVLSHIRLSTPPKSSVVSFTEGNRSCFLFFARSALLAD